MLSTSSLPFRIYKVYNLLPTLFRLSTIVFLQNLLSNVLQLSSIPEGIFPVSLSAWPFLRLIILVPILSFSDPLHCIQHHKRNRLKSAFCLFINTNLHNSVKRHWLLNFLKLRVYFHEKENGLSRVLFCVASSGLKANACVIFYLLPVFKCCGKLRFGLLPFGIYCCLAWLVDPVSSQRRIVSFFMPVHTLTRS